MPWFKKPKYTTLKVPAKRNRIPEGLWLKCPNCLEIVTKKDWEERFKVCPKCNHHDRLIARNRIRQLVDENTFEEFDQGLTSADPLGFVDSKPYPERIKQTQERTGEPDAIICGIGRIMGDPVSLGAMDFQFNGGSMGSVVGEKIARAMERGLERKIPVLMVCASGGARMQEGILSLMQMAKTSALVAKLGEAHVPYFVVLTNPTTAGVMASFASLGDVCLAEPDALIGFAGPRVIEQTIKQILPPGFQRSEFVQDHGFIDIIANRNDLRVIIARLIRLFINPAEVQADENQPSARVIESTVSS
jgi:acetyl-CoA carboxylase carboxyl transferase subunit beta